jgi:23S rRNA pseudouridine2605 synthase
MAEKNEETRLHLFMARCGIGSRRKCEKLIEEGLVEVNGSKVVQLGVKVKPDDVVKYKGKRIYPTKNFFYIALNKPKGYICSASDPEGRNLASDLLKPQYSQRLFSIGRLDFNSSGLIIYTNDGAFANRVSHPAAGIEKEYIVESSDEIKQEDFDKLLKGIFIEGERYTVKSYELLGSSKVKLVLTEGKNREIRNIFSFLRLKIRKLQRIRIGGIHLKGLMPGEYRELTEKELKSLKSKSGGKKDGSGN